MTNEVLPEMKVNDAAPVLCAQTLQRALGNFFRWFQPLPAWLGKDLLHQMCSLRLLKGGLRAPLFFLVLICQLLFSSPSMAGDAVVVQVGESTFRVAHDGLIEAIESEGLVIGSVLPFRNMLVRTALGEEPIPYAEAEIVQFCSGALAAELVREAPEQLTLCPLSVALYTLVEAPTTIHLAYRFPGGSTAGRLRADALLQRIVQKAAGLARLK